MDSSGQHPFRQATFLDLESPDPESPPEWNLANAKGFWTVQIAAYVGSPERKQAAVEAVREARKLGVEAYYYHGDTISSVCVGSWPAEAVKQQESDSVKSSDPSQPLLVVPPDLPLSNQQLRGLRDQQGQRVKVMESKVEILDPTIVETLKRYPYHSVNGEQEIRHGTPIPTILIPYGDDLKKSDTGVVSDTGPAPSMIAPTNQAPRAGEGQLRGIGG